MFLWALGDLYIQPGMGNLQIGAAFDETCDIRKFFLQLPPPADGSTRILRRVIYLSHDGTPSRFKGSSAYDWCLKDWHRSLNADLSKIVAIHATVRFKDAEAHRHWSFVKHSIDAGYLRDVVEYGWLREALEEALDCTRKNLAHHKAKGKEQRKRSCDAPAIPAVKRIARREPQDRA